MESARNAEDRVAVNPHLTKQQMTTMITMIKGNKGERTIRNATTLERFIEATKACETVFHDYYYY